MRLKIQFDCIWDHSSYFFNTTKVDYNYFVRKGFEVLAAFLLDGPLLQRQGTLFLIYVYLASFLKIHLAFFILVHLSLSFSSLSLSPYPSLTLSLSIPPYIYIYIYIYY